MQFGHNRKLKYNERKNNKNRSKVIEKMMKYIILISGKKYYSRIFDHVNTEYNPAILIKKFKNENYSKSF